MGGSWPWLRVPPPGIVGNLSLEGWIHYPVESRSRRQESERKVESGGRVGGSVGKPKKYKKKHKISIVSGLFEGVTCVSCSPYGFLWRFESLLYEAWIDTMSAEAVLWSAGNGAWSFLYLHVPRLRGF